MEKLQQNNYEDFANPEEREQQIINLLKNLGSFSINSYQLSHEDNENIILSQE